VIGPNLLTTPFSSIAATALPDYVLDNWRTHIADL
jgi:hypothetical protein